MDVNPYFYKRLKTKEVQIGPLLLGGKHSIIAQTMTTPDTMDTEASVQQIIECKEAGAEMVRLTAPSKKEAAHLEVIKQRLRKEHNDLPLVADIHFTPNAADVAAEFVEKVRVNPGNYVDRKRFEHIEYTDETYQEEIQRIEKRFVPLLDICKKNNTAIRIGTNHGSLSDRIMSRYGDTPMGMVESAMEFIRIARNEEFHNIVISMKSSNPQVMVQAYRLLVKTMLEEFGEAYPLHLGVTEAGDGEDGRIKSAVGIGTLLIDGIGDTIRVSLTEDPSAEIPVCRNLADIIQPKDYELWENEDMIHYLEHLPTEYKRKQSRRVHNIGAGQVPVACLDWTKKEVISKDDLKNIGYIYSEELDKWNIGDLAADYIFTSKFLDFSLPGTLLVGIPYEEWKKEEKDNYFPVFDFTSFKNATKFSNKLNIIKVNLKEWENYQEELLHLQNAHPIAIRFDIYSFEELYKLRGILESWENEKKDFPVLFQYKGQEEDLDKSIIAWSAFLGYIILSGWMDGIGLPYLNEESLDKVNQIVFSILQATRARISKTEYISCPSCGRTLFDLQETTAKVRARTHHLKGLKIAIMGCIVNGPGEMADADFGYVGSGPGKITLYKNKEVVKRNIDSEVAVDELIELLKENGVWVDPPQN